MANAINSLSFDNNVYTFTLPYGTCSTAASTAAKTVNVDNFSLETGARVSVKFTTTNTASAPTLNVESTGAKAIYYNGAAIVADYLKANKIYEFIYNGAQWDLIGDLSNAPVTSVNNKTGAVTLSANDVQARPNTWIPTYEEVGADKKGTAELAVNNHNTSTTAHNDIRVLISGLSDKIPEVSDWAKATTKPTYTKDEIGLGNVDNIKQYSAENPPPYPVTSVNNKTGTVVLAATDIGAATESHDHDDKYYTEDEIDLKTQISGTVTKALGGISKDKVYTNADIATVLSDLLFPYVAPTFSSITLSAAAGTFEYGTSKTVSKVTPNFTKGSKNITSIKIGTTSGGSDLYSGTSATNGTAITLTTSKTFDGTTGGTIYCTISDGTESKSASAGISYAYFNYVIVSSSTSAPTSRGSGKNLAQAYEVSSLTTSDNTYIWFLMPNQNKKQIQQFAMNQWNNLNTTYTGTVTFTTDTGKQVTYYAYRTDKMMSDTGKYRIN